MRFSLKDYQSDAVSKVLTNLADAKDDFRRRNRLIAFALSATTGAGKTVIATAVIEALFQGSEEFDFDPDPSAVVLWVTDDPSLNEQTRYRIIECGDRLDVSRLKVIGDGGFDQEKLEPGNIYFLNVQKLGSATTWVKHSDVRAYTLWETIGNTISDDNLTLYLVLDEAHKGMRNSTRKTDDDSTRTTIVKRLINGHGAIPPVPIVWGISATVQRFSDAMTSAQSEGRTTFPAVQVDPKAVQESGLLKDTILLDFPDEKGAFETTLLRRAVRQMRTSSELWADYAIQESLPHPVAPLLVIQVPNNPRDNDLAQWIQVIHEEWPALDNESAANVFGEHEDLVLGGYPVPYVAPQDVQDAAHIRVLFAKDAISTGWDCPRAEVMFSLRPAVDRTHITQLLGRMVRTPLARRIESDERLNSVLCLLPFFDRATATDVANMLTGEKAVTGDPDGGAEKGLGRKALTSPVTMVWNEEVPEEIKSFLASLPSEVTPKATTKPIKRLLSLAASIAVDNLMDHANEEANEMLFAVLDGQMAQHRIAVEAGVAEILTADIRRISSSVLDGSLNETTDQEKADYRTVDEAFRVHSSRPLGASIAQGYTKRIVLRDGAEDEDFDVQAAKAQVAALLSVSGVLEAVELQAEAISREWLNQLRAKIKSLAEARVAVYDEIKRQAREPQLVDIVTPKSRIENSKDAEGNALATEKKHLLSDENGDFPVGDLNEWERAVVRAELAREETMAWYRNPSSPTADALQIPYRMNGQWKPMQPDFIFVSMKQDGTLAASIVDPHGDHLSDALPKLQGLAIFAEKYGDQFLRIEAISQIDKKDLWMLDLTDLDVRNAVRDAASANDLYRSNLANKYL